MEEKNVKRSKFSSNLGMMLACIGGAVGLGNVWGFPSKLGRGGGFYFLIIYVVVALLLGIPMEEMGGQLPVMLLALNAVFVLYDCCFTRVMRTVMRRYRKLFLND